MKTNIQAKAAAIMAIAVLAAAGSASLSQMRASAEDALPETVEEQIIEADTDTSDEDPADAATKFSVISVADGVVISAVINFDGDMPNSAEEAKAVFGDIDEIAKDVLGDEVSAEDASTEEFFSNDQKIREALTEEELAEFDSITERITEIEKEMNSSDDEAVSDDNDRYFEELNALYDRLAEIVEKAGIDTAVPVGTRNVKIYPDSEEVPSYTYLRIIGDTGL